MQIYINRDGQRTGPHELADVNRQLAAGRLNPADLAWSERSPGWKPLLSFAGVIVPGGASSSAMPIGIATPVIFESRNYAGFWIRTVAAMVDAIILGFVAVVIALIFGDRDGNMSILRAFVLLALALIYMPALWSSTMQATLGQKLCRLRVIRMDGRAVSVPRGILRVFGMILSVAIFGIGYLRIAFSERKRGWHDVISGTCVLKIDI